MHLLIGHAENILHDLVALADKLDVTVLDTVVDHLYEMTGSALADPVATRCAISHFGAYALEYRLHERPGRGRAARHHGRALKSAFLAAGNSSSNIKKSFTFNIFRSPCGVREMGIATVNDNIALVKKRY